MSFSIPDPANSEAWNATNAAKFYIGDWNSSQKNVINYFSL